MLRVPSTTALLCFETSARLGSFTRAARELHLTQSAVSRQLITLEGQLGTTLFVRKRDALVLTDAGRQYLSGVLPALQQLERATSNVMAVQGRGGTLTLSVAGSLGSYWLMPRLSDFTRRHGEITLNLATRVGPADFTTAAIDASLEFGDGARPGYHNAFVMPLDLRPCASPEWVKANDAHLGSSTPPQMLIAHSTLPTAWPEWFAAGGLHLPSSNPASGPRYDLMAMAMNAAIAGLGVAMLPEYMCADALATKRLKLLSTRKWRAPKGYYLVYPKVAEDLRTLQTFKAWLLLQASTP